MGRRSRTSRRRALRPRAGPRSRCGDRKSTRLNSSHTVIYTLSLHDALPIYSFIIIVMTPGSYGTSVANVSPPGSPTASRAEVTLWRSEEHTSELQSHSDLHSFPTRRSSDLQLHYHRHDAWQLWDVGRERLAAGLSDREQGRGHAVDRLDDVQAQWTPLLQRRLEDVAEPLGDLEVANPLPAFEL